MTVEAVFQELNQQWYLLREGLMTLHTTVIEDKPLPGDHVLVQRWGDAVDDLVGHLAEGGVLLGEAQPAASHAADLSQASQLLGRCQVLYNHVAYHFWSDLAGYEPMAELIRLGREKGGEWWAWVNSVKEGLDRCRQLLFATNEAFCRCWQEIADRIGANSISVVAAPGRLTPYHAVSSS
ncbi:MAG: hypothetical protein IAF02_11830 [Anaerolineae bacterium]|nr:hypothetical protein [Anaerolineae bacterium]